MKKCNSCNIKFNTTSNVCPLCQNKLTGECVSTSFPKNTWFKTNALILKIILFATLTLILLSSFIEYSITSQYKITPIIILGLFTNYVVVYFILKNYKNIFRMFGMYGFVIIFLLILWYLLTKSTILTNYIIPSVCLLELLFNLIIGIILRRNYIVKYSTQILINIVLLFLPIILVKLDLTTSNLLSYICSLLSIISIIGLVIFFYDDIKEELKKIFNV